MDGYILATAFRDRFALQSNISHKILVMHRESKFSVLKFKYITYLMLWLPTIVLVYKNQQSIGDALRRQLIVRL